MLKRLLQDTATYGLISLANRLLLLLLFPVYARTLSPSELGTLDLVSAAGSVLVLVVSLEIVSAHARFSADAPKDSPLRATVAATAWSGLLLLTALAAVLLTLFRERFLDTLGLGGVAKDIAAPAVVLWIALVLQYMVQNHLRWESRVTHFAAVSLLQGIATLGLGTWLVVGLGQGARGALTATATGVSAAVVLGMYFLRKDLQTRPDPSLWRPMIRFCLPVAAGNLVLVAAQNADRFVIARMAGLEDLAQYGIALRFGMIASLVAGSAQMAVGPMVYDNQSSAQLAGALRQVTSAYALCGAALISSFSFFAPELVGLIASSRYAGSASLVGMTTASALVYGGNMLFPGLWLARRTRLIAACYLAYAVLLVLCLALGMHLAGLHGLAAGVLFANTVYLALVAALSRQALPVKPDLACIGIAGAATVASLLVAAWPPGIQTRAGLYSALISVIAVTAWKKLRAVSGDAAHMSGHDGNHPVPPATGEP